MTDVDKKVFPEVKVPSFPDRYYCITDFGAKSDITCSNTAAINAAIEKANADGGGHVVIPAGYWVTGPITLKSNVDLHLDNGALVAFKYDPSEYPLFQTDFEGAPRIRITSPVNAFECENVAITGNGILDGGGERWRMVKRMKTTKSQWDKLVESGGVVHGEGEDAVWFPSESSFKGYVRQPGEKRDRSEDPFSRAGRVYDSLRPNMFFIVRVKNLLIDGVTMQNSPKWCLHLLYCENVTLKNGFIRNPWFAQSGDGLDLESCRNVLIENMRFDVGDDAICIKSGRNAAGRRIKFPTEYVTVHDCTVYHGHGGFVVGSEMSRGVRNIIVNNCSFIGTDAGIRFKSTMGRGGVVEDILMENIRMSGIPKEAIIFSMAYAGALEADEIAPEDIPEFKNITVRNVICSSAERALRIDGLSELPIHDLTFENVHLRAKGGVLMTRVNNIRLKNVVVESQDDEAKHVVYKDEVISEDHRVAFHQKEQFNIV